jgi:hypothetical protein
MKNISIIAILFFSMATFAQTKLIAHKSHSGSNSTFSKALKSVLFDKGDSNFGMAPNPNIQYAVLDSVIIISDSQTVMVTSEVCRGPQYSRIDKNTRAYKEVEWKAGSDTVLHHPLFKKEHRLDSVRGVVRSKYWFKPTSEIVFIGFDEQVKDSLIEKKALEEDSAVDKKKNGSGGAFDGNDNDSGNPNQIVVLLLVLAGAIIMALVHFNRSKARQY